MKIEISVRQSQDDQDLGIGNYEFAHIGCNPMQRHRNPATSDYTLRCQCGIEVLFPQDGVAAGTITDTVIDGETRQLPAKSFKSDQVSEIWIVLAAAA